MQFYGGVAEPGYKDQPTALGNWNKIDHYNKTSNQFVTDDDTPCRVGTALEKAGINLEWGDEWTECNDCNKLVRTSADSYGWQRSYWEDEEGHVQCESCCDKDQSAYVEHLTGNDTACATFQVDLEAFGFELLEDNFQNGWYGGQDASPEVIASSLRERGVKRFIFVLDGVGQFDLKFSVWVHSEEKSKLDDWDSANKRADEDPAVALKRGLQNASLASAKLPDGPGVRYTKINSDGTVESRLVSPEEFVKGIKE